MSPIDWFVIAAGAATIAWVNWYFFVAQRSAVTALVAQTDPTQPAESGATAQVAITVRGGYDPATIRVRAGQPVRLVFDRQETSSCSEEVVFPDFGVKKFLPAFQKTTVEVTPPRAGRYAFTCGMSMLHGMLIAE
jgi:plastocyanin domain-containing protein